MVSPGTRNSDYTPELVSRAHTEATGRNWNYTEHRKPAITKKYIISVSILSEQTHTGIRKLCIILMGINKLCYHINGHKQTVYLINGHKQTVYHINGHKQTVYHINGHKQTVYHINGHKQTVYHINGHK